MSRPTFAELGVSSAVADVATRGIITPFEIQSLVIGDVLAGRDVHVKSPTGSGKTLAPRHRIARPPRDRGLGSLSPRPASGRSDRGGGARPLPAPRLSMPPVYGGVGFEKQTRLARLAARRHARTAARTSLSVVRHPRGR